MKLVTLTVIISFLLDSIISYLIPTNSLLLPLCSLISLIIIYPFFHKETNNYLIWSFGLGLLYDIVYTDTIFLNAVLFLMIAYMIKMIYQYLSNNVLNVTIISFIVVVLYRSMVYLLLISVGYLNNDFNTLVTSIYSSLLLNIVYGIILYLITNYLSYKYKIDKVD
ncbi:MAG: rod shape-determining protein MreD [Bacilli bacterium]|nr:rod shape-determining protein MreD [Bacilli bacterium]MDD4808997.1 rod shape-determining protein MreD [Bacilli bacterium]